MPGKGVLAVLLLLATTTACSRSGCITPNGGWVPVGAVRIIDGEMRTCWETDHWKKVEVRVD